jgi:hypothetical protein
MQITLSVLQRMPSSEGTIVHLFTVSADKPLDWFKQHADELAGKCLPGIPYVALNVETACSA